MERQNLSELIDSQDNLQVSADGNDLCIVEWRDGSPYTVASVPLDSLFDRNGNYFNRDI
jgi:hypothetical protein